MQHDKDTDRSSDKLKRLLDLSANIYANERDSTFRRIDSKNERPQEIIYVFDQTVLEMFIALDDEPRKYSAAFHLAEWRDFDETTRLQIGESALEEIWTSFNRQTAIITGEYLLSGRLPGQIDGQFYMTRGHYEEFGRAVDRRSIESEKEFKRIGESITQNVIGLNKLFSEGNASELNGDPYLSDDLRGLFGDSFLNSEKSAEFRRARRMANALSNAAPLGQIRQLSRVMSAEILDRIVPLDLRFPSADGPLPDAGLYWQWMDTIEAANRRRAAIMGYSRERGNVKNDAEAIAHVQWIARTQLLAHERIVFVTGDALLSSAYAKWHKDRVIKDPGEPRVLRKIQQYAPILNLGDMHTGITRTTKIFDMLREGVETSLLAFNLSDKPKGQGDDSEILWSSRSDLALRLEGIHESDEVLQFFDTHLTPDWSAKTVRTFNEIARRFREFERIAIGLSGTFVERRARSIVEHFQSWIAGQDLAETARRYIESLLDDVARRNIDLQFRMALNSLAQKPTGRTYADRMPRALRLSLPTPSGPVLLVDFVRALVAGSKVPAIPSLDPFLKKKHLVFAVATVASLYLGRWNRAYRFAELSISAAANLSSEEADARELESGKDIQELRYLCAVSCRMLIEARGPTDFLGDDLWASLLDEGIAELERSQSFYKKGEEGLAGKLRTLSESVAIRLAYASWLPVLESKLPGKVWMDAGRGYSRARAMSEFQKLMKDLSETLEIAAEFPIQATKGLLENNDLLQVYENVATAYVLTKICKDYPQGSFEQALGSDVIRQAFEWWKKVLVTNDLVSIRRKLRSVTRLQVQIFMDDKSFHISLDEASTDSSTSSLQLDIEISQLLSDYKVHRQV
jgi:hypothetical protein